MQLSIKTIKAAFSAVQWHYSCLFSVNNHEKSVNFKVAFVINKVAIASVFIYYKAMLYVAKIDNFKTIVAAQRPLFSPRPRI